MNPVAFITGGSRGIGLGIAVELARSGFDLAINGVRAAEEVANVISDLKAIGGDVVYCRGDVASFAYGMMVSIPSFICLRDSSSD